MSDEPSLNALGLRGRGTRPLLRFGSVDVSFAAKGGTVTEGLNQLSRANIELDYALTAGEPVDYLAPVVFGSQQVGFERVRFTGAVTEAHPEGTTARISALTLPELTETTTGAFVGVNIVGPEVMHLMARAAGLPENRIEIEHLDSLLPVETIEAVVPLFGVEVARALPLGVVTLVPSTEGKRAIAAFEASDVTEEFATADSYAVVADVGQRMLDVETRGIAEVDLLLAWFVVRSRYGLATMPTGKPQPFRRGRARAHPARGRLVLVRGMLSGRSWLRTPASSDLTAPLEIDGAEPSFLPPPGLADTLQSRQALLACARAATETDPLQRVQALWEAIEFYVAGVAAPALFDEKQIKRVKKAVPADLDGALRSRAMDLLAKINEPPLMARLVEALRSDGVPVAQSELELLRSLRKARNDASHGRSPVMPGGEEIAHAVSVVSRMLVYRLSSNRAHEPDYP